MSIPDQNTLEDILGAIWWAEAFPEGWDAEEKEGGAFMQALDEIEERINDKLRRNRNRTRANWFEGARTAVRAARSFYTNHQIESGREKLRQAAELLQRGNKAHRRKARFAVGPQGEVTDAQEEP